MIAELDVTKEEEELLTKGKPMVEKEEMGVMSIPFDYCGNEKYWYWITSEVGGKRPTGLVEIDRDFGYISKGSREPEGWLW